VRVASNAFVLGRADLRCPTGLGEAGNIDAGCEEFGSSTIAHIVCRNLEEAGGSEIGGLVFLYRQTCHQPG